MLKHAVFKKIGIPLLLATVALGQWTQAHALPGDVIWQKSGYGNIGSSVAINPVFNFRYVGSADHYLYAYDNLGNYQWRFKTGSYVGSSPTVSADGLTLYFGSYDGNVYAVNAQTGAQVWSFATGGAVYSSPALTDSGVLYVGSDDGIVYSINAATGTERWNFPTGAQIGSSPSVGMDGTIYVGSANGYIYALTDNVTSAVITWSHQLSTTDGVRSATIVGSDRLIIGTFDNSLYSIDLDVNATEREVWSTFLAGRVASSPAIAADGTIYVGVYDTGALFGINPTDGVTIRSYYSGDFIYSSPAVASDGTVYVGTYGGNLHALTPGETDFSSKWSTPLDSAIVSSPTVDSDGTVYIVSMNGPLYAIEDDALSLAASDWPAFGGDSRHSRILFDSDSDGLSDRREAGLGTNPDNPDSDTDGMPDLFEVTYGLDPLTDDSTSDLDRDGLNNLAEYQLGANPAIRDTDGDGIPDGWEVDNGIDPTDPSDALTEIEPGKTYLQAYNDSQSFIIVIPLERKKGVKS